MRSSNCLPKIYDIIDIVLNHYCKTNMMSLLFQNAEDIHWFLDILSLMCNCIPANDNLIIKMKHYLKDVLLSDDASSNDGNSNILLMFSNRVS